MDTPKQQEERSDLSAGQTVGPGPNVPAAQNAPVSQNHSLNKKRQAARASFHDYRAKGFYLITITTYPGSPRLSTISHPSPQNLIKSEIIKPQQPQPDSVTPHGQLQQADMIIPTNTPLGECVKDELLRIPSKNKSLVIHRYVIMPDHIHFVIEVKERLPKHLSNYIAPFTKACSQAYSRLANLPAVTTLFKPFDDQIIFNYPQLDRAIKYVEDNPRRYLLRRTYPDLFKRHLHLIIDNHEYAAYGNIFILKQIYLIPIRIHRYWSQAEFERYIDYCLCEIAKGAVPISPAIHKVEKYIMRQAIERGSCVIQLRDLAFNERFKPQGESFDLCAAGRLLLLSPWPDNHQRRSKAGYTVFHTMNDHAAAIASLSPSARFSIRLASL